MRRRAPSPIYDPSSDGSLALWLDPSDSSSASLLAVGGGAITNGAEVGTYKSKAGTARNFTQWGTNARPTWESAGLGGLGAIRSQSTGTLLATQTSMGDFGAMQRLTVMQVMQRATSDGNNGTCFGMTMLDTSTGKFDISLLLVRMRANYEFFGRRARGSSGQSVVSTHTTPTTPFIVTAAINYSTAIAELYGSGCRVKKSVSYHPAGGTTNAADPFAIAIGGFAQETLSAAASFPDGWIGETLVWLSATMLTPAQLFPAHDYLRRKWSAG